MDQATPRERQPRHLTADVPYSLDELAALANHEHAACEAALGTALGHALAAGDALLSARQQNEASGETWASWIAANFNASLTVAARYMRIAHYREELPADVPMSIHRAEELIRSQGLPPIRSSARARVHDDDVREEAVRLVRRQGMSQQAAAARLGMSQSAVSDVLNPAAAQRRNRAKSERYEAAQKALRAAERDKAIRAAVRKAGAGLSEAYSMSARMGKVLMQAEGEATTVDAREALADAYHHYHKMSDAIVRALGVSS